MSGTAATLILTAEYLEFPASFVAITMMSPENASVGVPLMTNALPLMVFVRPAGSSSGYVFHVTGVGLSAVITTGAIAMVLVDAAISAETGDTVITSPESSDTTGTVTGSTST